MPGGIVNTNLAKIINWWDDIGPWGAGGASISTGHLVYVDAVNGNDATGTRGKLGRPFLTLEAAVGAAQAGDSIIVFPGAYTPLGNLAKQDVCWVFLPNTAVLYAPVNGTHGLFDYTGITHCDVYGAAKFTLNPGGAGFTGNGLLIATENNYGAVKHIFFECDSAIDISGPAFDKYVLYISSGVPYDDVDVRISGLLQGRLLYQSIVWDNLYIGMWNNAGHGNSTLQVEAEIESLIYTGGAWVINQASLVVKQVLAAAFQSFSGTIVVNDVSPAGYCYVNVIGGSKVSAPFKCNQAGAPYPAIVVSTVDPVEIDGSANVGARNDTWPLYLASNGAIVITEGIFLNQLAGCPAESAKCGPGVLGTLKNRGVCTATKALDAGITVAGSAVVVDPALA